MNTTITGYVGLVIGACPDDLGNHLFFLDIVQAKIDQSPLFDLNQRGLG